MEAKKNSFILYQDQREIFESLPPEECKQLLLAIFDYREVDIKSLSTMVKVAFITFRNQLCRDEEKWLKEVTARSEAGKRGMASRWNNKKITKDKSVIPAITKITDNVTVNVNDNDTNKKLYTSENLTLDQVAERIVLAFNNYHGTKYRYSDGIKPNLEYWLKTYEPKEITQAIKNIKQDKFWYGKMSPIMLFRRKNPQGEPVDYISQFLSVKSEND